MDMQEVSAKIKQQTWIGEPPTCLDHGGYICDPRDSAKVAELIAAGVLPRVWQIGARRSDELFWPGWDLQNIPSAKAILATIPGDFSADGELLNFFYGEQWHPDVLKKRRAANPTRPCLTINQLPLIYAASLAQPPDAEALSGHESDMLKAWITAQNMDAQRMYNFMASRVVELGAGSGCAAERKRCAEIAIAELEVWNIGGERYDNVTQACTRIAARIQSGTED